MKLIISNISGVPIYEQIKQQVKSAIMAGELQEDEMLPSLRTLAKELRISVLTVTRAGTGGLCKECSRTGLLCFGAGF